MKTKRIFSLLTTGGLLAVLAITTNMVASAQAATPSLVGTWNTTTPQSEGNPRPTFQSMLTFFADGNMVETNTSNPATNTPAHGIWSRSGKDYQLTFESFTFDDQGKHTGKVRAYLTIKMDSPNHFTGTYTADLIDLTGKVTKNVVYGSSDSTRLLAEQP